MRDINRQEELERLLIQTRETARWRVRFWVAAAAASNIVQACAWLVWR